MRFFSKKCWYFVPLLTCWFDPSSLFAQSLFAQHGTAIVTLFAQDAIVMASDGMVVSENPTGNPRQPFIRTATESEAKIAVCERFLCGLAGSLITVRSLNFEFHFQEWLPVNQGKTVTTVKEYAQALRDKARFTFGKNRLGY